jgi:hypothetical protein
MGEIVPQIMEREIMDVFPLFFGGTSLQRTKPVVYAFLGQALAALRQFRCSRLTQ